MAVCYRASPTRTHESNEGMTQDALCPTPCGELRSNGRRVTGKWNPTLPRWSGRYNPCRINIPDIRTACVPLLRKVAGDGNSALSTRSKAIRDEGDPETPADDAADDGFTALVAPSRDLQVNM